MNRTKIFWLFVAVTVGFMIVVIATLAWLFWQQLQPEAQRYLIELTRQNLVYLFTAAVMLLAGLGFGIDWLFRLYILPLDKISEETRIIHSVNPSHRIHLEGSRDIVRLAEAINESADRYESLYRNVHQKIENARAETEEEKRILAVVMAELPEGVLICNTEGRILLYNRRVRELLTESTDANGYQEEPAGYIGLGRSVFSVIDKHLVVHALDEIAEKLERGETDAASYFVVVSRYQRMLKVEAVPILNHLREFTGFILILNDVTRQLESDTQLDGLLRSLRRGTRSSLASIRAAIEAIIDFPQMDSEHLRQFKEIIHKESINIGRLVEKTTVDYANQLRSRWPLIQMMARDVVEAVYRKADEKLNARLQVLSCDSDSWIKADSYSLISAIVFLLHELQQSVECRQFDCLLTCDNRFVKFDFVWNGKPVPMETLKLWEERRVDLKDESLPLTLKEVIGHHDGEIWSHKYDDGRAYLRLLLPKVDSGEAARIRELTILPKSRPEFFDFDLFNQPGQNPEIDNRRLSEVACTVFDTETTGLDPRGGDEIISIGAVRIVNGRLLHNETFDQLVDPRREIPPESTHVHGITNEMLAGQPPLEKVLPQFYRFAEETVLVAHNAAFDMRMLQLKESVTGVSFTNPVLDTLLLSAIVHPGHKNHDMEGIAARLGVSIIGRHTALGDAIATGEIFLKLLPLLEQQGITTLRQDRAACRKTYYSRLKY
jgi:DNA polymerase-3 subunit epsilon